jgi:hypothetical protein
MDTPKPTGVNGRSANGQFAHGNKLARGNPNNKKAQELRNALLETVTQDDLVQVTKKLIAMARAGDIHAIKELLDRCLGKPTATIELSQAEAQQRVEDLTDDELLRIARAEVSGG